MAAPEPSGPGAGCPAGDPFPAAPESLPRGRDGGPLHGDPGAPRPQERLGGRSDPGGRGHLGADGGPLGRGRAGGDDRGGTGGGGEPILLDLVGACHGYYADMTRTFVLGEARGELLRAYAAVRAIWEVARDALRPGIRADAIFAAASA